MLHQMAKGPLSFENSVALLFRFCLKSIVISIHQVAFRNEITFHETCSNRLTYNKPERKIIHAYQRAGLRRTFSFKRHQPFQGSRAIFGANQGSTNSNRLVKIEKLDFSSVQQSSIAHFHAGFDDNIQQRRCKRCILINIDCIGSSVKLFYYKQDVETGVGDFRSFCSGGGTNRYRCNVLI